MFVKGSLIVCDHCYKPLFRLLRDIHLGEPYNVDQVESIEPQPNPKPGHATICVHCDKPVSCQRIESGDLK